jgi:thiol:disulfide interchange protein DsbA
MRIVRTWLLLAASLLICGLAQAQVQAVAGRHFVELDPPRPVGTGARIEVIEFFYYGCPICYEAQPHLSRWLNKAGNDVVLIRVPAVSRDGWEPFARSFYALDAMGELARLHWPVYDNHHFDGKDLKDEKGMIDWVSRNGLDAAKFKAAWHSEETSAKVRAAQKLLDTYAIRGVPSMVVDGRFVTSARMAEGTRQMIDVLDQLVNRARAERGKK